MKWWPLAFLLLAAAASIANLFVLFVENMMSPAWSSHEPLAAGALVAILVMTVIGLALPADLPSAVFVASVPEVGHAAAGAIGTVDAGAVAEGWIRDVAAVPAVPWTVPAVVGTVAVRLLVTVVAVLFGLGEGRGHRQRHGRRGGGHKCKQAFHVVFLSDTSMECAAGRSHQKSVSREPRE
jgi:hypothetical protein